MGWSGGKVGTARAVSLQDAPQLVLLDLLLTITLPTNVKLGIKDTNLTHFSTPTQKKVPMYIIKLP